MRDHHDYYDDGDMIDNDSRGQIIEAVAKMAITTTVDVDEQMTVTIMIEPSQLAPLKDKILQILNGDN